MYRGVLLYGESGAGKSSLINAGLLPQASLLGFHPERVRVQARAGEELVIERIAAGDGDGRWLESLLAPADDDSARAVVSVAAFEERLRTVCHEHRPLIIFDQFEEILTLFEREGASDAQDRLVELIVRLLREPLPAKLLFAFREDYLGKVKQRLAACPELVDQAMRLVPPATESLPTIIRGPFETFPGHFAREFSPELTERLSSSLAARSGTGEVSLSEVQTVCLRLWHSDAPDALLASRGVQGLLEDDLGEALNAFAPDVKSAAIAVLGHMVTTAGTRDVVSAEELVRRVREEDEDVPAALVTEALERLEGESRLIRRERRRDLYLYEITSEFLVPWISRTRDELHRLKERRRERRRLIILASILGVTALIAALVAGLAVWALGQRSAARSQTRIAERQERIATSRSLASQSQLLLPSKLDAALLLGAEATRLASTEEARRSLIAALERAAPRTATLYGLRASGLAYDPSGTLIASTTRGQVELWNVGKRARTGDPIGPPLEYQYGTELAVSRDGAEVALGTENGVVRVWALPSRRPLCRMTVGRRGAPSPLSFSPDGRYVAVAPPLGAVGIWRISDGGCTRIARSRRFSTYPSLAMASSRREVAILTGERGLWLWDAGTGPPRRANLPRTEWSDVAYDAERRRFVVAGGRGLLAVSRSGRIVSRRRLPRGVPRFAYGITLSDDGRRVAVNGEREFVVADLQRRGTYASPLACPSPGAVAFGPSADDVAAYCGDGRVAVWKLRAGGLAQPFPAGAEPALSFAADRDWVALGRRDGRITVVHRSAAGDAKRTLRCPRRTRAWLLGIDAGDGVVTAGCFGRSRELTLLRWSLGTPPHALPGLSMRLKSGANAWLSGRGHKLAVLRDERPNGRLELFDVPASKPVAVIRGLFSTGFFAAGSGARLEAGGSVAFSRDERLVAIVDEDAPEEDVELRATDTGQVTAKLRGHRRSDSFGTQNLAFSEDGRTLVRNADRLDVWRVPDRRLLGSFSTGVPGSAELSPHGGDLVAAGFDGLRAWSTASGLPLGGTVAIGPRFAGGPTVEVRLAVDPVTKRVVTFSPRTPTLTWDVFFEPDEKLRERACTIASRPLSQQEWSRYLPGRHYQPLCAPSP